MTDLMNRLLAALNAHDLDAFVGCFASDYHSEQPAHPGRAFEGRDKVPENWTSVFAGISDFQAELLTSGNTERRCRDRRMALAGDAYRWKALCHAGRRPVGIEGKLIAWGRLYMEAIEQDGGDIDAMVRETYRPPD